VSLATRLSAFFLAALAVVLLGFSGTLYLLARNYLLRRMEERLESALDTLAAAAEQEPDGLEWEPHDRDLALGRGPGADQVRWEVRDEGGRLLGRSPNLGGELEFPDGVPWKCVRRRLEARSAPGPLPPGHHAELMLTAGLSLAPLNDTLGTLALTLAGLSLLLWVGSALVGRRLCRRALAPLARMAGAARGMGARDLTERLPGPETRDELTELCDSFNGLLGRLQEAFERQRRFTGDASHQLRTPLTVLLGQVEVALRRDRTAEEYRVVLALVQTQADHLRRVVEAMLFLARADTEAGLGKLERLNLAAWVAEYLGRRTGQSGSREVRLEAQGAGELWVKAQGPLLGQLLDNLLENACKYSPPDRSILVRPARDGETVTLTVEDHGQGIAAEDLPHIFEPFYRSAEARRLGRPGVGLGLAIARRIAAAFGGTLIVESSPGQGSRFTLCLPAREGDLRG
jgi:heavy metal sensor kinase